MSMSWYVYMLLSLVTPLLDNVQPLLRVPSTSCTEIVQTKPQCLSNCYTSASSSSVARLTSVTRRMGAICRFGRETVSCCCSMASRICSWENLPSGRTTFSRSSSLTSDSRTCVATWAQSASYRVKNYIFPTILLRSDCKKSFKVILAKYRSNWRCLKCFWDYASISPT